MKFGHIDLEIDELMLYGFPSADAQRIHAALERELVRLLREKGIPARPGLTPDGGEIAALHLGTLPVGAGAGAPQIGAALARSVYRGLCSDPLKNRGDGAARERRM